MAKQVQIAGRCVFCSGFGLTKEHIWSDWLTKRGTLPNEGNHIQWGVRSKVSHGLKTTYLTPYQRKLQNGPPVQKKIRRVCKTCNGGWMSNIVHDAIPYADPMVRGMSVVVPPHSQRLISAWVMLACIMAEFTDEQTMAIPSRDRDYIRENGEPPSDWYIFVGHYQGVEWVSSRYRHHGGQLVVLPSGIVDRNLGESHYYQVSTYVLGGLAIDAFSSTYSTLADEFRDRHSPYGMEQIWPPRGEFRWPPEIVLGDTEIMMIADDFSNQKMWNR